MACPLSDDELVRLQRIAVRVAGIVLEERHRDLIGRRIARKPDVDLAAALDEADAGEPAATQAIIQLLTTQHTQFFRTPQHFDIAAEHALWAVHRRGRARAWCAGVATGEEAYSLALALVEVFGGRTPGVDILATDIDQAALAVAQRGEYDAQLLAPLPESTRAHFTETSDRASHRVSDAVRALVRTEALNLADVPWRDHGPFDLVFCRNVLMYLSTDHRYFILEQMTHVLASDGLLFLDPAEYLGRATGLFTAAGHGVYTTRSRHALLAASRGLG